MSVGGKLIEIRPMVVPETGQEAVRLWVMDEPRDPRGIPDETCVYVEPQAVMPGLGDAIWWQGRRVYFDGDRQFMTKVGFSFAAPGTR